ALLGSVEVVYPTDFDLFTAADVASATADFQALVARAGALPETEALMLGRLVRLCLPGLSDAQYARCDSELTEYLGVQAGRYRSAADRRAESTSEQILQQQINVL